MKNLIIIGAGGFGREVAWLASEARDPFQVLGFLDDRTNIPSEELGGHRLLGGLDLWPSFTETALVIAIGNPRTRYAVAQRLQTRGETEFATLVHRSCLIGPNCHIAAGSMVCAGCILTTNINVGPHSILNIGTTVGHDVQIGSFVTVAPQVALSGCVVLGDGVEIGTASSIRQGLCIGEGSMLGMGSTLTKDMPENTLFFGSPAKQIKPMTAFRSA